MLKSLSSASSGIRSHQSRMDVIGNNVANVNTNGFKSSRAIFSDVLYQNMNAGRAPAVNQGGINPTQIGYGAAVATIDRLMAQGALSSTERPLDVYINGEGMITVQNTDGGLLYTRFGSLGFDGEGNLVDPNGKFVMGFPIDASTGRPIANPDGSVDMSNLSTIRIDPELLTRITGLYIAPNGDVVATLPGNIETTLGSQAPSWMLSVDTLDPNITGDVNIKYSANMPQITNPADWEVDWVQNITAMEKTIVTQGKYVFSFDPIINMIIVMDPSGRTFSGRHKRNGTVELVADNDYAMPDGSVVKKGTAAFKLTTNNNTPNTGGQTPTAMGTMNLKFGPAIVATARTVGGTELKSTYSLDNYDPKTQKEIVLFTEDGGSGVVITLDPDSPIPTSMEPPTYTKSVTKFPTNYPAWLTDVDTSGMNIGVYNDSTPIDAKLSVSGTLSNPIYTITAYVGGSPAGTKTFDSLSEITGSIGFGNGLVFKVDTNNLKVSFNTIITLPSINYGPEVVGSIVGDPSPAIFNSSSNFDDPDFISWLSGGLLAMNVDQDAIAADFPGGGIVDFRLEVDAGNGDYLMSLLVNGSPTGDVFRINPNEPVDSDDFPIDIAIGAFTFSLTEEDYNELYTTFEDIITTPLPNITYSAGSIKPEGPPAFEGNFPDWIYPWPSNGGNINPSAYNIGDVMELALTGPNADDLYAITLTIGPKGGPPTFKKTETLDLSPTSINYHKDSAGACLFRPLDIHVKYSVFGQTITIPPGNDYSNRVAEITVKKSADTYPEFSGTIAHVKRGDGQVSILGRIALAKFSNEEALDHNGGSYYKMSANSGDPTFFNPGSGGTGKLLSNYLETSNVDISKEIGDMIITQRGFQANTRIFTVSDEMIEEIVNLKR